MAKNALVYGRLIVFFGFLLWSSYAWSLSSAQEEKLDAKEIIFEHILDAHEWEIAKVGEKHIAIPLPVILIHDGKISAFMSNKLAHGATYKGFKLMNEGKYKGKIAHFSSNENGPTCMDAKLPLDFSITKNVCALFISSILIILIFCSVAKSYKKRKTAPPKGFQSLMEPLILFVKKDIVAIGMNNEKQVDKFAPYMLTLFFFILINNVLGIIPFFPGGANLTGNIAVTAVLAVFTFIMVNVSGTKHYWKDIINTEGVPWWLKFPIPLMPLVEIVGVFTKPIVLMIRLFANITAGHIIVLGLMMMIFILGKTSIATGFGIAPISIVLSLFMDMLELLVAFVQAYVFTLLSSLYIGMATKH